MCSHIEDAEKDESYKTEFDEPCENWSDFKSKVNGLIIDNNRTLPEKEWIFRGILKSHKLETTLERACKHWRINQKDLPGIEEELIREIQRKAFGLGIPLPDKTDNMWWISLMQHYGAPTRLLDFTYSPYVAAYFALEKLLVNDPDRESATIWAIQHAFTMTGKKRIASGEKLENIEKSKIGSLDFVFDRKQPQKPSIMQVNSFYLHDRIIVQQGIFLCATDLSRSFMENFESVPNSKDKTLIKRFILPSEVLKNAMAELHKMNITRESLFPGIAGLAESIAYRLPYFSSLADYRKDLQ